MRPLRLGLVIAALVVLAGCTGHGRYTRKFEKESKANMALLRGATEYDRANQQFLAGNLDLALRSVESSITLNDKVAKSHLLRGRILIEKGRVQDALEALQTGHLLDLKEPDFRYYRGVVFEELDQLAPALGEYSAAVELDAASPQYRLAAAEVLVELDRPGEAKALLEAGSGELTHPAFRQALGHIATLEGDRDAALRFFSEAAVLSPGDPVLLEDLVRAQLASGRHAEAEITLREIAKHGPYATRSDLQLVHAQCLIQLHRPVEARRILVAVVQGDTGEHAVEAWTGLVDVALMLRDDRLLRSAADRLLAIAPDRHEGYLARATWQRRTGDLAGALRSAGEAVARAHDDPTPRQLEDLIRRQLDSGQ